MDLEIWRGSSDESLVIRTDFDHPEEWLRIRSAITEPQTEDEFEAYVRFVDDRAFAGITVPRLLATVPRESDHVVVFLVDTVALTHPEHPVLVVNLYDYVEGLADQGRGPQYGDTFRVVPSEAWSVQNNLPIANMDWEEFAGNVDADGIFRGFE